MENRAFILIGVMLGVIFIAITALGTLQYFHIKKWNQERDDITLLAFQNMASRLDYALETDYFSIEHKLPELSQPIIINGYQGFRSTFVKKIDDPLDGLAPIDTTVPDYLDVIVTFAWFSPDNIADSLNCIISEERYWNY